MNPAPALRPPAPVRPWWGVLGTVLLTALTVLAFPPWYETNDDAWMNAIAAGVLVSSQPDEHLIFTQVWVGLPLVWLYRTWPAVPWYGLYHILTVTLSAAALAYVFLRANPTRKQLALTFAHFGVVVVPCLTAIQFTKTAFLAAEAGAFLILGPLLVAGPWPRRVTAAGVALAFLGAAVRFESFVLAAVLLAPLGVVAVARRPAGRRWWPTAAVAVAVGVGALLLNQANRAYYARSPGWEEFYEYNALRAQFTDYHAVEYSPRLKPILDSVGWTEIDLAMLQSWFFADPQKYQPDKLRRVLAGAANSPHLKAPAPRPRIVPQTDEYDVVGLWVAVIPAAILTGGRRGWTVPVGLFGLGCVAAFFIAGYYQYLPQRVLFCVFCPAVAGAAACSRGEFAPATGLRGAAERLAVAAVVLLALWQTGPRWADWRGREDGERLTETEFSRLDLKPDQLLVIWGAAFPYEYVVRPFGYSERVRTLKAVGIGCSLRTPLTDRRLAEFGIDDLYLALYRRPDVYLVCDAPLLALFNVYVNRTYGDRVLVRIVRPPSRVMAAVVHMVAETRPESKP